jgi:hypothetical protein
MDWLHVGWQKITVTLTGETMEGSVAKWCLQRGILLPLLCYLFVDQLIEGLRNGCYTLGYVLSSTAGNSQILSHSFFRRL